MQPDATPEHRARVDLVGILHRAPNVYLNRRGRPAARVTVRVESGARQTLVEASATDERVVREFAKMPQYAQVHLTGFLSTRDTGQLAIVIDGLVDDEPAVATPARSGTVRR